MTHLLNLYNWLKLNAVMLAIFAAVLSFCTVVSYFKGRDHGADACQARYEKEKAQGFAAVNRRLVEMNKRNAELAAQWQEQNRLTEQALDSQITNTYKVVEKIIEKPVPVTGDCDIGYELVELLNDAATPGDN
jgi:hypothetical protein